MGDVADSSPVEKLKAKRQEWGEWLSGEDHHSVSKQITMMLWDAAVYNVVNEARRIAEEEQVSLNNSIHGLINRGFSQSQFARIRRLMDKGPTVRSGRVEHAADGKRGVFSLLGLLEDMERNIHLLTRENILAAEGLEYDAAENRQAGEQYGLKRTGKARMVPADLTCWSEARRRHKAIDKLAGVNESARSPGDTVRLDVFLALKAKLAVCDDVKTYVDKYIAHSATPERRQADDAEQLNITRGHIEDAHKAISEVAGFVETVLLWGGSGSYMATPQFNQFENMDVPLVSSENIGRLADEWDKYDNAQRVVEAGVGIRLPVRRCKPGTLREAVERVLGDPT